MSTKLYYHVSATEHGFEIKPLNSQEEVEQAILQSAIISKHKSENIIILFLLARRTDVWDFYTWLAEVEQRGDMELGMLK